MIFQTLQEAIDLTRQQQAHVWIELLPEIYLVRNIWGEMSFIYKAPDGWQVRDVRRDDWKLMKEFS